MSALHQAVARAIAEANCGGDVSAYCFELREDCECRSAAYAAIRAVLAEAQRLVEAERAPLGSRRDAQRHGVGLDDALDVLRGMEQA